MSGTYYIDYSPYVLARNCSAALNTDLRFLTGSGAATLARSLERLVVDLMAAQIPRPVPGFGVVTLSLGP